MVGPDFVPCYESLVFKLPENGSSVPWHRDGNAKTGDERIFNIDLYPDRSTVDNACVWVIPGSHKWEHGQAWELAAKGRESFDLPGAVPAETEPGDVLLHHVKVLHGSDINRSSDLRRVVYFDNRAKSWNDDYGWFKPEFIDKRARLYQHALHVRSTQPYPSDDAVFDYQRPPDFSTWSHSERIDLYARRDEESQQKAGPAPAET
jgi:phytanoyl-CoA hydroxylase